MGILQKILTNRMPMDNLRDKENAAVAKLGDEDVMCFNSGIEVLNNTCPCKE